MTLEEPLVASAISELYGSMGMASMDVSWPDFDAPAGGGAPGALRAATMVHLDARGRPRAMAFHKHQLVRDLNLRYREALQLDPLVPIPFPAAMLVREKAIIVNLEAVRMVICANQCYVISVPKIGDLSTGTVPTLDHPFIEYLSQCLAHLNDPVGGSRGAEALSGASGHDLAALDAATGAGDPAEVAPPPAAAAAAGKPAPPAAGPSQSTITGREFDSDATYELRALEVALRVVVRALRIELHLLERTGYPALARMTAAVSATSLRQVRDLKADLARLTRRVETLRGEVDKILRSDREMEDMYLGRKAVERGISLPPQPGGEDAPGGGGGDRPGGKPAAGEPGEGGHRGAGATVEALPPASRRALQHSATSLTRTIRAMDSWRRHAAASVGRRHSGLAADAAAASAAVKFASIAAAAAAAAAAAPDGDAKGGPPPPDPPALLSADIEACEDLMESSFINLEHILRSLTLMAERIASDELLLRIAMDSRRNSLVQLELWVSNLALGLGFTASVAGIFGMNLINTAWWSETPAAFWTVVAICALGTAALPLSLMMYMRKRRLNLTFDAAL